MSDARRVAPASQEQASVVIAGTTIPSAGRVIDVRQIVTAVDHLSGVWTRRGSLAALYGAGGVIIFLAIITKWFGFGSPMEPVEFIATLVIGLTFIVIAALFSYLEYRTAVQLFRAETKVWEEWEHVKQGAVTGQRDGPPKPPRVG